jgi:hypothetical protein
MARAQTTAVASWSSSLQDNISLFTSHTLSCETALGLAVAAENFFNRMNAAFGVEEQGFCAAPGAHARTHP